MGVKEKPAPGGGHFIDPSMAAPAAASRFLPLEQSRSESLGATVLRWSLFRADKDMANVDKQIAFQITSSEI